MNHKKILILTERFYPEEFLINDLAAEWKSRGYEVEVLTQVPSYPHDRVFAGYRNKLFQRTVELEDIPVHRVKTINGYNHSVFRKILNYLSFAFLTSLWALFRGWHYDLVFTYHTGPLTMASAGLTLRFIWRRQCMIWTQDIWPDTVYAYGFKPTWWKRILLDNFVRLIYLAYQTIAVSSPGSVRKLLHYTSKEVIHIPQWIINAEALPPRQTAGKMVFTFAGNIGSVQNLELLLEAFAGLDSNSASLQIVGGGIYLDKLQRMVAEKNIESVVFTGRQPQEKMRFFFQSSDVLIISLSSRFTSTVPAKFQAYIAAGRPLFGVIAGDTADLILKHKLGLVADPDSCSDISKGFTKFITLRNRGKFEEWRQNCLNLSAHSYNRENLITRMTELLCGRDG